MFKNIDLKKIKFNKAELKENFDKIKAQYDKDAIIYTVLLVALVLYAFPRFVFPNVSEIRNNLEELKKQKQLVKIMENKVKEIAILKKKQEQTIELPIKIYEPQYKDIELENAATGLINRIIAIIKENGTNTVESFEFKEKELMDQAGLKAKEHSLLTLTIKIDTTYENIQNIINEIYLLEYLININNISMEAKPDSEERVKTIITLDLFIKTS